MNNLWDIDIEKRKKIMNASLEEFASHGFSNASTNRIIKRAGISKGLLFYYFQNKQQLFYFLLEFAIDYVMDHYVKKIDIDIRDFFERYKQQRSLKHAIYQENPYLFSFLSSYYYQFRDEIELPKTMETQLVKLEKDILNKLHDNLDMDMFREDMSTHEVFTYIKWLLNGYEADLLKEVGDDLASVDWNYYFERDAKSFSKLKKLFYKKEYQ
ncbi:TetR family transcriptional regulator [Sporosarcina sp. NCCP-2222]|uniref:TetR/AcrR family transcriptional regulator n=1 Tax=Sporosarcina sp. NCCP-2222 TaxID=2935073 RepID=UPI002084BCE6|nr:TetR/AcrR family transcriptional regulator [Sporosarcina sp. NCCP-2222]GKV57968.1 TetR family transcriptional regulator [Sporosarcina sp. NCCP-2222]